LVDCAMALVMLRRSTAGVLGKESFMVGVGLILCNMSLLCCALVAS
jgi:hypothetical protein